MLPLEKNKKHVHKHDREDTQVKLAISRDVNKFLVFVVSFFCCHGLLTFFLLLYNLDTKVASSHENEIFYSLLCRQQY